MMRADAIHLPAPRTATDYRALYVAECARAAAIKAAFGALIVEAGGEQSYWGQAILAALRGEDE